MNRAQTTFIFCGGKAHENKQPLRFRFAASCGQSIAKNATKDCVQRQQQYIEVTGDFSHYVDDPYIDPLAESLVR